MILVKILGFLIIFSFAFSQDTIFLKEVVVSATRYEKNIKNVPDYIKVITQEDIKKLNVKSLGEMLNYSVGINTENGTGGGYPKRSVINMNGFPANYNLILIDGVKLITEHIHTGQNIEYIPVEMIERIEIIEGASSAQYGSDAMGGIINIITKKSTEKHYGQITTYGGNNDNYLVGMYINTKVNNIGISSCAGWENSNGIDIIKPESRKNFMGYNRQYIMNNLNYDISEKLKLTSALHLFNNRMEWNDGTNKYSHLYMPNAGYVLKVRKFEQRMRVNYTHWEAQQNSELHEMFMPEIHNVYKINENYKISGGVDYRYIIFQRAKVNKGYQDIFGFYLTNDIRFLKNIFGIISIRTDYPTDYKVVLSPKASLMYRSDSSFYALKFSVGRGFRYPTIQDKYEEAFGHSGKALRFGNPDLKPEYSTTFTIATELYPSKFLHFQAKYFYNIVENMIIPVFQGKWHKDTTKYVWMRQNIQQSTIYGYEINLRLNTSNIFCTVGYTESFYSLNENVRQLSYIPGKSFNSNLSYQHLFKKILMLTYYVQYKQVFGRKSWNWKPAPNHPFDDPSGLLTPLNDYNLLSGGIKLLYNNSIEVNFSAYNILKQKIELLDDALLIMSPKMYYKFGLNFYF